MATPAQAAADVLIEGVARDLPGLWSLLYAAELLTLRLADGPGRVDAGAVTAGMDLRQAVEELEWDHPDIGAGAVALDPDRGPVGSEAGRAVVEELLLAALDTTAALVLDPDLPVDDVLMLARVVGLIMGARRHLSGPLP